MRIAYSECETGWQIGCGVLHSPQDKRTFVIPGDWVILDTPPVMALTDASVIAHSATRAVTGNLSRREAGRP